MFTNTSTSWKQWNSKWAKTKNEIFNTFFASKSSVHGADDDPPNLQRLLNVSNLDNINTSPLEVGKFIQGLKKSHSSHCAISSKFLQIISSQISYSLSKLFNNLFEIGHYPDIWKVAHITAVYKRSGPKNVRQASISERWLYHFSISVHCTLYQIKMRPLQSSSRYISGYKCCIW